MISSLDFFKTIIYSVYMRTNNQRPDTKQRILRAACELLEHEGMDAVSIRRVAKKVQITPMGIYNHFPSLEALLLAVYETGVSKLARYMWKELVRADSPHEKLRALVRSYIGFGTKNPHYYSLIFGTEFIQKYLWDSPPRSLVMENFWLPFTEVIEACQESGLIDPAVNSQEIATHLWASMHGYVSFLIIGRLQQLWQMDEENILKSMEKHLLPFLR
jgi:AcrR family transcriptional regulator